MVQNKQTKKRDKKSSYEITQLTYLNFVPGLASASGHALYQAQSQFTFACELKLFHSVHNNDTSTAVFPVKVLGFSEDNLQNLQIVGNIMTSDVAVLCTKKGIAGNS